MSQPHKKDFGAIFDTKGAPQQKKVVTGGKTKGLKATLFRLNPTAHKQLSLMAVEEDSSIQALLVEALNDLFRKYKRQPIA